MFAVTHQLFDAFMIFHTLFAFNIYTTVDIMENSATVMSSMPFIAKVSRIFWTNLYLATRMKKPTSCGARRALHETPSDRLVLDPVIPSSGSDMYVVIHAAQFFIPGFYLTYVVRD